MVVQALCAPIEKRLLLHPRLIVHLLLPLPAFNSILDENSGTEVGPTSGWAVVEVKQRLACWIGLAPCESIRLETFPQLDVPSFDTNHFHPNHKVLQTYNPHNIFDSNFSILHFIQDDGLKDPDLPHASRLAHR